jgi:hypothetical protein
MQFRVPQNIAMEDRIIGPLSPIQFGIVVIGGGISFFLYSSTTILTPPLNAFSGIIMALITVVFAVGKFNGHPMYKFIKFIILFIAKPKVRIWHKEGGAEVKLIKPDTIKPEEDHHHPTKNISRRDIARLAEVLDSRGSKGVVPQIKNQQGGK